jgi:hypothetical protein
VLHTLSEIIILELGQSLKDGATMIHLTWKNQETIKKVKCVHTDAKKYLVHNALTTGKVYDVKNETEEFYYIIDNTGKVGGFYKEYFQDA